MINFFIIGDNMFKKKKKTKRRRKKKEKKNQFKKFLKKNKTRIILTVIFLILSIAIISFLMYASDYYHADLNSINAFSYADNIERKILDDNTIVYEPENSKTGLIFYPGGKVEYTSYEPLMEALASEGITSILVKMPFNLAVLDVNAADGIKENYQNIEKWYIGGHSLGGAMAASYISTHLDEFNGLILLAAYSTSDLSKTNINVISIYGSNDLILNENKYTSNKQNLPINFNEEVIEGGCHSFFGMYGYQEGDGIPSITNQEQIIKTSKIISKYI